MSNLKWNFNIRPKEPPKSPNRIVAETILVFMRAIFDENHKNGNWYLNPKTQMYIREDYPRDPDQEGFKPSIIMGETGGVQKVSENAGMLNFIAQNPKLMHVFFGNDEAYQGTITLKTLSQSEAEAENIAYLVHLSINSFADFLIGVNGIAYVDSPLYSSPEQYETDSDFKAFVSQVHINYVIRIPYMRTRTDGVRLNDIDVQAETVTYP